MAMLTIAGKRVKVSDDFLSLSPEEQQRTANEIAAQIGATAAAPVTAPVVDLSAMETPPSGAKPGSREYADWAAARTQAGNKLPQVSEVPAEPVVAKSPDMLQSTLATVGGLASSVPFLTEASDVILATGQTGLDAVTGQPVDIGKRYSELRDRREQIAEAAPIANMAGQIAGVVGSAGALGTTKLGAEALGMTGNMAKQLFNSFLSTGAYEGVSGLSKGHTGGELLADIGIGGVSGLAGPVVGKVVEGTGKAVANALTDRAQTALTKEALARGAPDAAALRKEGSGYFGTSVDDNPVMITGDAYHRLLGNIQRSTLRYRPNQYTNPQGVGLLEKFWAVADDLNTPGSNTAVDLKDLHILRQAANEVANDAPSGQSREVAGKVIRQLDRFIKGLKPEDTLGGVDPTFDAETLMDGISTWARASKVGTIEKAIEMADTAKSGFENGLKQQFLRLMKSPDFKTLFTPLEQAAIRKVAHGSRGQNVAETLGKLGLSFGGHGAHNIIGAGAGTAGLTAALTPVLGPAAFPVALTATTAVGAGGRRVAEAIGKGNAERVAQMAATPGIKTATPRRNALEGSAVPFDVLIRALAATGGTSAAGLDD